MSAAAPSRWPAVRAAGIAAVLFVHGLATLPLPHSMRRASFDEPVAQEELSAQARLLRRIGVNVTTEELVDVMFRSGTAWVSVYNAVLKPVEPAFRITGTGQSWGLFTYPDTFPHQLIVEVRSSKSGPWATLFAGLDPEHRWMRDVLAYRRVRGVYDGQTTKPGASWNNLTKWLARRAFTEDPAVQTVRVSFRRFHTVKPGEPPDTTVEAQRHARTWARAQVMR
jgi:hypothetical protein